MDEHEIQRRLAEGRRRTAALEDRAAWYDALAREFDEDADDAGRLLVDVLAGWGPDVLQGRTAEVGHAQLTDQRSAAVAAAHDIEDLADRARQLAHEARAEIAGLQADAARLQVRLAEVDGAG